MAIGKEELECEVWKDTVGYEGHYMVSNLGRVKSIKFNKTIIRKKQTNTHGYNFIKLLLHGKPKLKLIHRLVAQAFLEEYNEALQVNHLNEIKIDNRLSNLEMCTPQYNVEYSSAKKYKFVSPDGDIVEIFNLTKFCREQHLDQANMWKVYNNKTPSSKGWTRYNG